MKKKILITGSEGFIGSHIVDFFLKKKLNIKCFVQYNSFNNWGWLEESRFKNKLKICAGDIRDSDFVDRTVSGCTHVIHWLRNFYPIHTPQPLLMLKQT